MLDQAIILQSTLCVSTLLEGHRPLLVTPFLTRSTFAEGDIVRTDIDWFGAEAVLVVRFSQQRDSLTFVLDAAASSTHRLLESAAASNQFMLGSSQPPGDLGLYISEGVERVCTPLLEQLEQFDFGERHDLATFVERALSLDVLLGAAGHSEQASTARKPASHVNVVLGMDHMQHRAAALAKHTLKH